jgi:hypothetical protein
MEARLLELPLANRYSGLVDRGETVGYSPQLEAKLLELPLANRYSGLVDRGEQLARQSAAGGQAPRATIS